MKDIILLEAIGVGLIIVGVVFAFYPPFPEPPEEPVSPIDAYGGMSDDYNWQPYLNSVAKYEDDLDEWEKDLDRVEEYRTLAFIMRWLGAIVMVAGISIWMWIVERRLNDTRKKTTKVLKKMLEK